MIRRKSNPLSVLEDDDNSEIFFPDKKKKRVAPNWELVLPGAKSFSMKDVNIPTVILIMKALVEKFKKHEFFLRREVNGKMEECDWRNMPCKRNAFIGKQEHADLLLELIISKMKEKKNGDKKKGTKKFSKL